MNRYWFKPKPHGFGATPTTWEGWLSTLVCVVVIAMMGPWIAGRFADPQQGRMVALLAVLAVVAAFVGLCALKTEGGRRWRSGGKDD